MSTREPGSVRTYSFHHIETFGFGRVSRSNTSEKRRQHQLFEAVRFSDAVQHFTVGTWKWYNHMHTLRRARVGRPRTSADLQGTAQDKADRAWSCHASLFNCTHVFPFCSSYKVHAHTHINYLFINKYNVPDLRVAKCQSFSSRTHSSSYALVLVSTSKMY